MNIVVLGGGTTGKFGNDFVKKARGEGHRVIVLSHKDHGTGNSDDRVIDYNNLNSSKMTLQTVGQDMPSVDIVLFNQNGGGYPFSVDDLFGHPDITQYTRNMAAHAAIPQLIVVTLLNNLHDDSKVVFMSSTMAFEYDRNKAVSMVGYPAGKSFATHLMTSMARTRPKKITFSAICPFFLYHDVEKYQQTLKHLYDYILNHDDTFNGKIVCQLLGFDKPPTVMTVKYHV